MKYIYIYGKYSIFTFEVYLCIKNIICTLQKKCFLVDLISVQNSLTFIVLTFYSSFLFSHKET